MHSNRPDSMPQGDTTSNEITPRSTVYGPVHSWRYGMSLGVDLLLETSICSFNCVYCQLGNIERHTGEQRVYIPTERVVEDFLPVDWNNVDIVAFSGSGEPTLALNLGEAIAHVKDTYGKPVLVLTNSVHLRDREVRQRLARADVVACKLDAPDDRLLRLVNRPIAGVTAASIVEGIEALRNEGFPGKLALQCMLMPANLEGVPELAKLIRRIGPDEVQLNTPRRPYPRQWYPEARGNHGGTVPVPHVELRTVSLEEAEEAEAILRQENPDIPVLSIYRTAPEEFT